MGNLSNQGMKTTDTDGETSNSSGNVISDVNDEFSTAEALVTSEEGAGQMKAAIGPPTKQWECFAT